MKKLEHLLDESFKRVFTLPPMFSTAVQEN